ncbi:radical SAM/SPASM domain-containing protein [Sulfurimonas sp.]|uniref:radical SAM protein n=1 Tax=Sulfurimonas sp. TaxID=2022749 RepID=UPI00356449DC
MRKPWRITIDTNPDQCNLNCIMCDTHSIYNSSSNAQPRRAMNRDLLSKSIDQALSIGVQEIIPSTMGEPLMYHDFDLFIEKIANSKIKLNLTTNGTFPIYGVEKWAEKLLPILSDIKISINSLNPNINEKIMPNDDTLKKIENIKKFVLLRDNSYPNVSITMQVTFLKSNLDELENIIKFAIEHNIDRVKGHQLWVTFSEIEKESLQNNEANIIVWNQFIDKIEHYKDKIKLVNFEKILIEKDGLDLKNNCPFLGEELWIDHEGTFNICCAPSNKRTSLGEWGNIKNRSIENMFNSLEYEHVVKNYKEYSICKECSLR